MQKYDETTIDWPTGRKGVLSAEESRSFRRAQEDGFLRVPSQSRRVGFTWSFWCYGRGHPVVVVELSPRYAHVWVDLYSAGQTFTPAAQDAVIETFKRCNAPKWACGADATHATVSRELGEPLARELLDIVLAMRRAA